MRNRELGRIAILVPIVLLLPASHARAAPLYADPACPACGPHPGALDADAPEGEFIDLVTHVVYRRDEATGALTPVGAGVPAAGYVDVRVSARGQGVGPCGDDYCVDWHVAVTGRHVVRVAVHAALADERPAAWRAADAPDLVARTPAPDGPSEVTFETGHLEGRHGCSPRDAEGVVRASLYLDGMLYDTHVAPFRPGHPCEA